VRVEGAYGSRTIETEGLFRQAVGSPKALFEINRPDGRHTLGRVMHELNRIGATVYAEGKLELYAEGSRQNGFGWGGFFDAEG